MRFVLVHGGFHGAWCWDRLRVELARAGHDSVAVSLPGSGERADEPTSLRLVRDAVLDEVEDGDVLVGHSGGGYVVTLVADAEPHAVRHLVYLASGLPAEGTSIVEAMDASRPPRGADPDAYEPTVDVLDGGDAIRLRSGSDAIALFYGDCDPADAAWAAAKLTAQRIEYRKEPVSIPRFWAADLPRSFIRCAHDRAQPRATSDWFARRLGVDPLVIETAHSPFLSRPGELASLLVDAVGRPPVGPLLPT
jgi:pimeloyl-ACP methyl ester carboxylesterase